jgi:hypothetical protein
MPTESLVVTIVAVAAFGLFSLALLWANHVAGRSQTDE